MQRVFGKFGSVKVDIPQSYPDGDEEPETEAAVLSKKGWPEGIRLVNK
jgi:hypothetical protein